jgi:hypothetical protein
LINVAEFRKLQGRGRGEFSQGFDAIFSSRVCIYCGRLGHTVCTCYKMHDFSQNYGKNVIANNSFLKILGNKLIMMIEREIE